MKYYFTKKQSDFIADVLLSYRNVLYEQMNKENYEKNRLAMKRCSELAMYLRDNGIPISN